MEKEQRKTVISAVLMIAAIVLLIATKHLNILLAILMIGLVICFHEFGHFVIARVNGVTVKEFSIGMGPRLLSRKIRGTRWSIKLFPFGGSCLMLGEDEPIMIDPEAQAEDASPENEEAPKDEAAKELAEEGVSFKSKGVWQRISIVFAGPFFNFILAFLLACIILGSIGYDPAYVTSVSEELAKETGLAKDDLILEYNDHTIRIGRDLALYENLDGVPKHVKLVYERDGKKYEAEYDTFYRSRYLCGITYSISANGTRIPMKLDEVSGPAAEVGLKPGDIITAVNGVPVETPEDFQAYTGEHPFDGSPVTLKIRRGDIDGLVFTLTPIQSEEQLLGFSYNINYREKTGVLGVIRYGFTEVRYWMKATVKSLGYLLQGKASRKDVGGAVRVVSEVSNVVDTSYKTDGAFYAFLNLINWAILLSANLGVMNLLPIPALDGGRLLFLLIEAVRGKPVNPKVEGYVTLVGFVLLMLLMVFILYNDISNVFGMLIGI